MMGKKKPVTLGTLEFKKKGDAIAYLRAILHKYDPGDKVNTKDAEVLRAALTLHPEASTKVGCGIESFSVRTADYGTKCFWVNRTDGSSDKFSYKSCISV
jgi:hypothetical protein